MSQYKDLSEAELIRRVEGETQPPNVKFYEKAHLDRNKSTKEGRRIYQKVVMIDKRAPGQDDWAPAFATDRDFEKHPEEYQKFLNTRSGKRYPGIDTIPGLDETEKQYLVDLGYSDIKQLSEAVTLPEELHQAQKSAQTIYNAMRGIEHGKDVPTEAGSKHGNYVGRRTAPAAHGQQQRGSEQGIRQDGLLHSGERHEISQEEGSEEKSYQKSGVEKVIAASQFDLQVTF